MVGGQSDGGSGREISIESLRWQEHDRGMPPVLGYWHPFSSASAWVRRRDNSVGKAIMRFVDAQVRAEVEDLQVSPGI